MTMLAAGGFDLNTTDLANFAQFGFFGVVFLLILGKRLLVPKWTLDDLKDAHERELAVKDQIIVDKAADIVELKKTLTDLQALTSDKLIPALVHSNSLTQAYVNELARRGNVGA